MMRGLVLVLLLGSGLIAVEHGVTIQAVSPWNDPRGYTPVVVTLETVRELTLTLTVGDDSASATGTARLSPGRTVRQTLLIPPTNEYAVNYRYLRWSGPDGITSTAPITDHGRQRVLCALIDPKQQVDLPAIEKALTDHVPASSRSGSRELIQRVAPEELPDRWQGYPDWLVLVLTPLGDAALDDAQRQAITAWTRGGGTLVVSTSALHQAWQQRQAVVFLDPLTGDPRILKDRVAEQAAEEQWQPIDAPVPGTEVVPVKTFVVLALAFAIVVGPLNLWWVRRRNARHLFLVTTPALSFVTCVVLIVASLVADGVSIRRSAVQVGYLDQRTQQLVRWTGCTYFAAFAQSRLELDAQAKLRVLDREDYTYRYRHRDDDQRLHLDWSTGQLASGTVIPARLNRQLAFTELLPERRRLVISRSAEGYQVVNGLGVEVASLRWRDGQGGRWWSGRVGAGEGATLAQLTGRGADKEEEELPSRLTNRIGREVATMHERVVGQPFSFSATLAAPLDPLPGPTGTDPEPPEVMLFGYAPLAAETRP